MHHVFRFWLALALIAGCSDGNGPGGSGGVGGNGSCAALSGTLSTDTTVGPGCINVIDSVFVEDDSTLTVAPGSTLIFAQDTWIHVEDGSSIVSAGTADNPNLFTGAMEVDGYWGGINILSNTFTSSITYTTIQYAGSDAQGEVIAAITMDGAGWQTRLTIENSTIQNSGGYGLLADENAVLTFVANTLTANSAGPAFMYPPAVKYLDGASDYSGNAVDYVTVESYSVTTTDTWNNLNVDYLISGELSVEDSGVLTIAAGTGLVFEQDSGLWVGSSAALTAVGTADAKITFRGEQAIAGYWTGIYFTNSNSVNNALEHCVVTYGGGPDYYGDAPANVIIDSSGFPARASISDCEIAHSAGYGVWEALEATVTGGAGANNLHDNAGGNWFKETGF